VSLREEKRVAARRRMNGKLRAMHRSWKKEVPN